ncbi:hypothetical protein [Paenibacillus agaridevorans]|nr:hypothetical protein [Paenibacillus agaridevorans]
MYLSKKKKIRGWRRHVRKIEMWKQRVINLDMRHLSRYQRDYAKLWIHPFYAIPRKNPPGWYNQLLLEAMLEVYQSWLEKFTRLDESFYLKLWIYEPHFINSQVVTAYKDCLHFYDRTFDIGTQDRQFPFHKYPYLKEKLQRFDWRLHIDCDVYTESDLVDNICRGWMSFDESDAIKAKAYKVEEIRLTDGGIDKTYSVKVGDVWVGSLKN